MIVSYRKLLFIVSLIAINGSTLCVQTEPAIEQSNAVKELHWDWDSIDIEQFILENPLPQEFFFGAGTSAHQVEGNCTGNSFSAWENTCDEHGNPRVTCPSGLACDHWNRFKQDIQLIKQFGLDTYRMSVEWSKVEPEPNVFSQEALNHYKEVCQELRAQGIQPLITLHHYTDPLWFTEKGGFEKEENIPHFVQFCTTVFQALQPHALTYATFNSPCGYAAKGWLTGNFPPGKKDKALMAIVLKNILEAHVQAYKAIKAVDTDHLSNIGILKNEYHLTPWNKLNPLDHLACAVASQFVNDCFYSFFTEGVFSIKAPFSWYPFLADCQHINQDAPQSLDWIGLNCYSHAYMKNMKQEMDPAEPLTNNKNYTNHPESLYHSICRLYTKVAQPLGIPIYITENGIATNNDAQRELFMKKITYILHKAYHEGYPIKGYSHWALMDNYEWGELGTKNYGLYKVDFADSSLKRTLKDGALWFSQYLYARTHLAPSS